MAREPLKCFRCVPRRPGLLAWAYMKLVFAITFIGVYLYTFGTSRLAYVAHYLSRYENGDPIGFVFEDLLPVLCLPYLVFTIIFIIGLHRQNSKLLLVFLVYSVFEVMFAVGEVGWQVLNILEELSYHYSMSRSEVYERHLYNLIHSPRMYFRFFGVIVVNILLPIYFFLLIKSEVQRLKTAREETRVVPDEPITKEQQKI